MATHIPVIHSDPEILGDAPVFVGTRVPFRNLIDYLERDHSLVPLFRASKPWLRWKRLTRR